VFCAVFLPALAQNLEIAAELLEQWARDEGEAGSLRVASTLGSAEALRELADKHRAASLVGSLDQVYLAWFGTTASGAWSSQ